MKPHRRAWWALYALGVLLTLGALAWISVAVLDLGAREGAARLEHRRQQAIRLALWRMDSWFGPQLAVEVARLPHEYQAYTPQALAYTRVLNQIEPGAVLVPSPLLSFESDLIRLHFQVDAAGIWTSPQVPEGNSLDLAEANGYVAPLALRARRGALRELGEAVDYAGLLKRLGGAESNFCQLFETQPALSAATTPAASPSAGRSYDQDLNLKERNWRVQVSQQSQLPVGAESPLGPRPGTDLGGAAEGQRETRSSPLVPLWLDRPGGASLLVCVRRVRTAQGEACQGFLPDWERLRRGLVALITDLLPQASVEAQRSGDPREDPEGRLLATLPAILVPGELPPAERSGWRPAQTTLLVGWLVALTALGVVGLGLRSSIRFGEQRSRFASTVTHELRTPLTTFRLYSEMLAADVVPLERRQEYFETLERESARLNILVENVLSYSRLEQGGSGLRRRPTTAAELLERARPALERRAAEAGMELGLRCLDLDGLHLKTDPEAVSQILFNLVDNACKYGRGEGGGAVELSAQAAGRVLHLRVRDRGVGVPRRSRRAIFQAFDRGGRDVSDAHPGVGLGLALARGLARDLGGDLVLEPTPGGPGATFCLWLPCDS